MTDESIFRFIAVRQPPARPRPEREPSAGRRALRLDLERNPESALQKQIRDLVAAGRAGEARRAAAEARQAGKLPTTLEALGATLAAAVGWVQDRAGSAFKDLDIAAGVQAAAGKSLKSIVASEEFKAARGGLGDALVAGAVLGESEGFHALALEALKTLKLLEHAADGTLKPAPELTVGDFLRASLVVVPAPGRAELGAEVPAPPEPAAPPQGLAVDMSAVARRFEGLKALREELALQLRTSDAFTVTTQQEVAPAVEIEQGYAARICELERANQALAALVKEKTGETPPGLAAAPAGGQPAAVTTASIAISPAVLGRLRPENLKTLQELVGGGEPLAPMRTMALLDRELHGTAAAIALPEVQTRYVRFAGGFVDQAVLYRAAGFDKVNKLVPAVVAQCRYEVGVADLLLVRQKLKAYELAEFAHVENALRGELREREHRRVNLREETVAAESEREVERERNLQSTERNEMQAEASKQLKSEAGLQAGLQVSGSYGPTVSFSASLNASFATSVQESQRKAVSFSREVTERTSERVRERVREERRRRVLEQIEELNRHRIDNATNPQGHVRGIYRWLNKVYDAQVFNYGKRMMYEFIIPEPAAFLIYTLVENAPVEADLPPKPSPPVFSGTPLKPENLTRYNYQRYVAQYHITNAPPPPSEFKVVAHFDKLDGQQDPAVFGRAAKIALPDDYEALGAYVSRYYVFPQGQSHALKIVLGGKSEDIGTAWGSRYVSFREAFRGELSIAYGGFGLRAFGLGVDVFCSLTEEGFAKWQQKAYDAIIEAYERQRADYEEKLAAAQIARGVQAIGRNPLENRRLEQDELKKWIVMILRGSPYLTINSFLSSSEPVLDIAKACQNGKLIRFLENAFEWHNMSYVCYPYFWGRKARWAAALHFTDPDPDFAAFLKAGAARVQVPVRPGFETAVAHFCDTGAIPEGEATLVGGSLYVPIVQEITESLGKLDDGVPYPEGSGPWEVRVPTTLVVLQDLDEVSGIRDILTGNPIKLLPAA